jgi:ABC-type glycerol-3-phosphate transport system permease component
VALAKLFTDECVLWELLLAGSFIAAIPVLIIFLFLQRDDVEGFTSSSVKG